MMAGFAGIWLCAAKNFYVECDENLKTMTDAKL